MAALAHLTINTGHARQSPRAEVADGVVAALADQLGKGTFPVPGFGDYRCQIVRDGHDPGTATFTVWRNADARPQATCFVCWSARASGKFWGIAGTGVQMIRQQFARGTFPDRMPAIPRDVPWLAALTWPTMTPDAATWLADFERCLAWALIESDPA